VFCQADSLIYKPLNKNVSIDPDSYSIVLSRIGKKWNNKIGGEYDINILKIQNFTFRSSIGGFVNIHNFDEGQKLSWQLWRGSLGISTFYEFHNSNLSARSKQFIIELAWIHESQHATDLNLYTHFFISSPQYFNNSGARSFEYFKLKTSYMAHFPNEKWQLVLTLGYKYYPKPLGLNPQRILLNSFSYETSIERRIFKRFYLYSKFYNENIYNDFVAKDQNYKGNWSKEPFTYRIFENGIGNRNSKDKIFNVFFYYSKSNGRGLDFILVSESIGGGLRIVL
jgi:hypothetical protein